MATPVLIGLIILFGMILAWVLHGRSARHLTPILTRLAAETNGVVETQNPFVMPKLLYSYSEMDVEVSSALTGIDGNSIEFSYVLFKGLQSHDFEFRILPRSLQSIADEWVGFTKPMAIDVGGLKTLLVISTNDDTLMQTLLSDRIQGDLLFWADRKTNRISDIRNYDDKLIYAVTGMLGDYDEFKLLLDTACRFVDRVVRVLPNGSGPSNDI